MRIVCLAILLLCIPAATALTVEFFDAGFFIAYDKVVAEYDLVLNQTFSGPFALPLPEDAAAISFYQNGQLTPYQQQRGNIVVQLEKAKVLKLSYLSKSLLEEESFLMSFPFPFAIKRLEVSLTLPEYATLARPLTETSGSAYPRPTQVTTDGVSITLLWLRENLPQGELPIYVLYRRKQSLVWVYVLFFLIVALSAYVLFKKSKVEEVVKTEVIEKKVKEDIAKHLKEDEQQVIAILRQREGQCEQGTLRVITGFSKAKLSSLLSELEERKIVYKEKRGKKNLIFLKE